MAADYVSRPVHRLLTHETVFLCTKTEKSSRTVALSLSTIAMLRKHLDKEMAECILLDVPFTNDRLVLCQLDGKPLISSSISQAWRRLTRRLGHSHIRFHDLRHT
ncbi:tyrosine-type recombinase/integrase [Chloroflexota bacterium]